MSGEHAPEIYIWRYSN